MKKIFVIVLCFMMIFMFTACQDDTNDLEDDNNDVIDDNNDGDNNDATGNNDMDNDNVDMNNDNVDNNDENNIVEFKEDVFNTSVYTRTIDDNFIEIGENDTLNKYRLNEDMMTRFNDLDLTAGDKIRFKYKMNDDGERELVDIEVVE